jgi:hypothetical protein
MKLSIQTFVIKRALVRGIGVIAVASSVIARNGAGGVRPFGLRDLRFISL